MLTETLRAWAIGLDGIADGLIAAVPMIRDDLSPGERAAVNAAVVIDTVSLELLAFARSGDPDRLRELAHHVTEWLKDNVGYATN